MRTFNDLVALGEDERARIDFIQSAINEHINSDAYKMAWTAEEYYAKRNVTISKFQKLLYDAQGIARQDLVSANYKLRTTFFRRFVIQQVQYVLSNGVTFEHEGTKAKLGADFDTQLQKAAKKAMVDRVSYLFFNKDHVEVFSFVDTANDPGFVPLEDEDDGAMKAGIRYWKICPDKPQRATLYELDGYTEYIKPEGEDMRVLQPKKSYLQIVKANDVDGVQVYNGDNYAGFPIVPMYANDLRESEIVGIRESIDCYDFIKSNFANELDDSSGFYWTFKNAGGMDDDDIVSFINRLKMLKGAALMGDQEAEAHTLEVPVAARESLLNRLETDLYRDFQIVNVVELSAAQKTATEIRAAYQPMDDKCGDFEYCIIEAIQKLLALIGVDDYPKFQWNRIPNQTEETQMVLMAANYLDDETILNHLSWITPEEREALLKRKDAENLDRFSAMERQLQEVQNDGNINGEYPDNLRDGSGDNGN